MKIKLYEVTIYIEYIFSSTFNFFLDISFGQKLETGLQLVEHIWMEHPNTTSQQQELIHLIA